MADIHAGFDRIWLIAFLILPSLLHMFYIAAPTDAKSVFMTTQDKAPCSLYPQYKT